MNENYNNDNSDNGGEERLFDDKINLRLNLLF